MNSRIRRLLARGTLALVGAAWFASASAQVVINEIHYNPLAPGLQEFLELHNRGAASVDVSGWSIADAVTLNIPAGTTIPAGGYLVVTVDAAALQAATGYAGALQWTSGNLSNGGEIITLRDASVATVDVLTYDDVAPWPTAPDGTGPSLELTNPVLDNSLASAWLPSTAADGTPGAQNSVFSSAATIQSEVPARRTSVPSLTSVTVTFSASVTGVTPGALTVGGSPATAVGGSGAGPYVFSGFAPPPAGSVTIALAGGSIVPFAGDSWTVSTGINVVINELHYHPFDVDADAEFVELTNAGSQLVDLTGWKFSAGIVGSFPAGTTIAPGAFLVFAKVPALLQARTGYVGSIAWTSGSLSNGGETIAIADAANNVIDAVPYTDSGTWPTAPDGDGPSLELINPTVPNQYGGAWRASLASWGTPGAANGTFVAAPPPIINEVAHAPILPAPNQSVTITALVIDDAPTPPTVTLYHRQDFDPTIAYTATPMVDDGLHGDGAAGDGRFGATVTGLPDGTRLDFAVRADDGTSVSTGPPGHNTLNAGEYPSQTYLVKFSSGPPVIDFPHYHLITTQRVRNLQETHDETEYDGTFVYCPPPAGPCQNFYNVVQRYRGQSSLNQHPHSYRVNFPASSPLPTAMGFPLQKLNLHAQQPDRQFLGYQFFREAFGGSIPTSRTQFVRLDTSPLSHGGIDDYVYVNVEKEDEDFLESQDGAITPLRFPSQCSGSLANCTTDADCPSGQTCLERDSGNIYQGVLTGDLQYLGTNPDSYRPSYEKESNEADDVWTDLIDLTFALDPDTTPDGVYESAVNAIADEDEWARYFAIHMLLVNQEGGIYRDTGDDFYVYIEPPTSPRGYNTQFIPRDLDSVFGGFGAFNQETIWRTNVQTTQRFIRNNAYAGRFVGAICELLDTQFTQPVMDARIDALPDAVADSARKAQFKSWVGARIGFVNAEIQRTTTLTGVPASPYENANPVINLGGQLNQCGTYRVLLNGSPVPTFSVFNHTWSSPYTLSPGPNQIVVQSVDVDGVVIDQASASVVYAPPGTLVDTLDLTVPARMINDKTLTLKAEIRDPLGNIEWRGCERLGAVSATRVSDASNVPITVTVFDNHVSVPADSIRFYNGVGSISFTLDAGASFAPGDIDVTVTVGTLTATQRVTVVAAPTFRNMSGTLSGPNLTWGPDELIRVTGNVTIPSGSTLDIHPGTLVMVDTTGSLDNGTLITVDGSVNAVGTKANPIFFFSERGPLAMTLTQSGSASNPNCWRGIHHFGSATSTYKHVFLTGAGNGTVVSHPRPPILAFNGGASFLMEDDVFVDNNGMAIAGPGTGTYTVRRLLVSRCGIGAEFNGNGHTLTIEDTWWTSTGWAPEPENLDGDLIHIDGPASVQNIRRSIFTDGGDDGIDHNGSNFNLENSIISKILDKAISMTGGHANLSNVLIHSSGSAVRGAASADHVTITSGNILTPDSIQQSILWTGSNATCPDSLDVDFSILGNSADLGCGTGNLSVNPQFVSTSQCDYNPAVGSPALTAGPTGNRIGWLGFPEANACQVDGDCNDDNACTLDACGAQGVCTFQPIVGCTPCTTAAECGDGNPCTIDTCTSGVCGHQAAPNGTACDDGSACTTADACNVGACTGTAVVCNDGNACTSDSCAPASGCSFVDISATCDDGLACTADSCSPATGCQNVSTCPVGQVCGSGGVCSTEATVSFQDGVSGYAGTQDTYVAQGAATTVEGALDNWRWDNLDLGGQQFGLIRFDAIFGNAAGQIPPGATILTATLGLTIFNGSVSPAGSVNEVLAPWSEATTTWNNFGGEAGVQADEFGALVATAPIASGAVTIDVATSLQAWAANPSANLGWIFRPASDDGVQVRSAEYAVVAERPRLTVTYSAPAGCGTNEDCDDGLFCNGVETCAAGACQAGSPPDCDDGASCSLDTCNETTDACEHTLCTMSAAGEGSRYVAVTPPAGQAAVAIRVSSPALPACGAKYVDASGLLVAAPVFQSSAAWGTVHVSDRMIVPATAYDVFVEASPGVPLAVASATTWAWGDANNVGGVDVFDILCVTDGTQSIFTHCTPHAVDLRGDVTDRLVDGADVGAVLDAFSGQPYPDATPCGGP